MTLCPVHPEQREADPSAGGPERSDAPAEGSPGKRGKVEVPGYGGLPDGPIVVTGANGVLGAALIGLLAAQPGAQVRALVRGPEQAARLEGLPVRILQVDYRSQGTLDAAAQGAAVIVHLAGALQPRRGERLHDANVETTQRLVSAGKASGVRRFVYLSAPGATPASRNEYLCSKGVAESSIREAGFRGVVFRVPMVLGRGTPSMQTLMDLARRRMAPLVRGGKVRIQPVALADVTRGVRWALGDRAPVLRTLDLVGPEVLTYVELLGRVADLLGGSPRVLGVPGVLAEVAARVAGPLGSSWNWSFFDTLFHERLGDPAEARRLLPFPLTSVDGVLHEVLSDGHGR